MSSLASFQHTNLSVSLHVLHKLTEQCQTEGNVSQPEILETYQLLTCVLRQRVFLSRVDVPADQDIHSILARMEEHYYTSK